MEQQRQWKADRQSTLSWYDNNKKKNLKEKFVNHLFSQFVEKVKKLIRFSLCQNEKKEPGAVLAASGVETLITRRFTLHPNEFWEFHLVKD